MFFTYGQHYRRRRHHDDDDDDCRTESKLNGIPNDDDDHHDLFHQVRRKQSILKINKNHYRFFFGWKQTDSYK